MHLIFDTSIIIELERGNKNVIARINELRKMHPIPAKISFITRFEFLFGINKKSEKNKAKSADFLDKFDVLHTTNESIDNLILLKKKYELPLADLLIASQAMETGGLLVTKDKDFDNINEIEKVVL